MIIPYEVRAFQYCQTHKIWSWAGKEHVCMADDVKVEEDGVALWLNGGGCQTTTHEGATQLQKLVMLKMLRLDMPHQSTQIKDIERAIAIAAKKEGK